MESVFVSLDYTASAEIVQQKYLNRDGRKRHKDLATTAMGPLEIPKVDGKLYNL